MVGLVAPAPEASLSPQPLHADLDQDDRRSVHSVHSVASTVATTTSLASRIASLALDWGDRLQEADEQQAREELQRQEEEEEEEEQEERQQHEEEQEVSEADAAILFPLSPQAKDSESGFEQQQDQQNGQENGQDYRYQPPQQEHNHQQQPHQQQHTQQRRPRPRLQQPQQERQEWQQPQQQQQPQQAQLAQQEWQQPQQRRRRHQQQQQQQRGSNGSRGVQSGDLLRLNMLAQQQALPQQLQQQQQAQVPHALAACSHLFHARSHHPLHLRRLSMMQVEDFRQHGYIILDGFIPRDAAARIKAEALRLHQKGMLQPMLTQPAAGHPATTPAASSSSRAAVAGTSNGYASVVAGRTANGTTSSNTNTNSTSSSSSRGGATNGGPGPRTPTANACSSSSSGRSLCEHHLPLQLGRPPADTAAFAPLLAALKELQDDLHDFMQLAAGADYTLRLLPAGATPPPPGRPDKAAATAGEHSTATQQQSKQAQQQQAQQQAQPQPAQQRQQQRSRHTRHQPSGHHQQQRQQQQRERSISVLVFCNADWQQEGGGVLRLWPPKGQLPGSCSASPAMGVAVPRRSPASSDAGTGFSEVSECSSSFRLLAMGSTTSSVIAEASAADHYDACSLDDGISLAGSEAAGEQLPGQLRGAVEWVEVEGEMALDVAPVAGRCLLLMSGAIDTVLLPPSVGDVVLLHASC